MGGRGIGFRRNAGRTFRAAMRKPSRRGYIETGGVNGISFATALNVAILTAADAPDKTVICNLASAGTSIQVENNAVILKRGSFISINFTASAAGTLVGVWLYMNKSARVTPPTDTTDFNEGPQTEDNIVLRSHTIFYRRFVINAEEERHMRIPLWSKRNRFVTDNSVLRLVIQNFQPAAGNVNYSAYGRVRLVE